MAVGFVLTLLDDLLLSAKRVELLQFTNNLIGWIMKLETYICGTRNYIEDEDSISKNLLGRHGPGLVQNPT